MLETTVCKIVVKLPYDDSVDKFDNKEAADRSAKGKKVIFLGC
tara:strand:- start:351 stop:479 length:129 start_codon:yes stop_codon:yes gene_type:complete